MQDVRRVYIDHIRHHIGHIYALPNSLMSRASADQELIGSDLECAAEQTWDIIIWRMKGWDWREQAVLEQQTPTGIPDSDRHTGLSPLFSVNELHLCRGGPGGPGLLLAHSVINWKTWRQVTQPTKPEDAKTCNQHVEYGKQYAEYIKRYEE